ncbi:unnamed protein product [Soboliphyme baturini]|uniref:RF_PROK_I domain-containing protein n=1 Tax=Soboliphyme baturini TaxID=241478 RepID=A0A183IIK6_9BILA|nr:unnamed protein product [Soboliphyme baturini]
MNSYRKTSTIVKCLKIPYLAKACISRKNYQFPEVAERDLEEQFVSGSGPGGQKVNTSQNCVVLKHLPTGIVVKVHESRNLEANRKIARHRLTERLDHHFNGDQCFAAIKKKEQLQKLLKAKAKAEKIREKRAAFKESVKLWQLKEESDEQ